MIITSLLDNDLYKFTMQQAVFHRFPNVNVEYQFVNRDPNVSLRFLSAELKKAVQNLGELTFSKEEIDYLASLPFLKPDFITYLQNFRLKPEYIDIQAESELSIIIRGPWLETILFEIPLLMIVSELYNQHAHPKPNEQEGFDRAKKKIQLIQQSPLKDVFKFSDFGNRRRFSFNWIGKMIERFSTKLPHNFVGTSSIFYAMKYGLTPVGTCAHEFMQAGQALASTLRKSQSFAWKTWQMEYGNQLSVALSDTLGMKAFLADFDEHFCQSFQAIRQDSGDPFEWGEAIIKQFERFNVEPKTKMIIFSDSLTIPLALKLCEHFHGRINVSFGIGTHLTNDLGYDPLHIVIKMTECNGKPVAKISDTPEKTISKDPKLIDQLIALYDD